MCAGVCARAPKLPLLLSFSVPHTCSLARSLALSLTRWLPRSLARLVVICRRRKPAASGCPPATRLASQPATPYTHHSYSGGGVVVYAFTLHRTNERGKKRSRRSPGRRGRRAATVKRTSWKVLHVEGRVVSWDEPFTSMNTTKKILDVFKFLLLFS